MEEVAVVVMREAVEEVEGVQEGREEVEGQGKEGTEEVEALAVTEEKQTQRPTEGRGRWRGVK